MSIERGPSSQEVEQEKNEIQVGGGDIIKVSSLREIIKKKGGEKGEVEFTGSGKYHPILPLLPQEERKRQIELNITTGTHFLDKAYQPKGFFPPEMCYSEDILPEIIVTDHQWVIVSGIACPAPWPVDQVYQVEYEEKRLA